MGNSQEEATQLKNKGNEAFKNQDWATAVDFYTKAIELWDKEPSFYLNRAQVCGRTPADIAVY
jgi:serine/threonine-protein phosphatase 5